MGVRLALGARPGDVLALVVREAVRLAVAGIVLGTAVALAVSQLMRSLLYETSTRDAATFAFVPLVLLLSVILAAAVPALGASRVDPMVTLRDV